MFVLVWIGFIVLVLLLLALDLGVLNREPHEISAREALGWTAFWIALALVFNAVVYLLYEHHWLGIGEDIGHPLSGSEAALEFFSGYLVEKSLSLDNIFVIALVFDYFRVPLKYQHRVLFWGVLGALVMRGAMIAIGLALIARLSWIIYVFGGLLILTAAKMLFARESEAAPERNLFVRLVERWWPVTTEFHGQHLFVRIAGRMTATPLFLALVLVESTDVLFAVDSIPAVFAITRDPFLVFTSNVFAILGLRSLYFALAAVLPRFRYLRTSLVFLLLFIGAKMILSHVYPLETDFSLAMIAGILMIGVFASLLRSPGRTRPPTAPFADDPAARGGRAVGWAFVGAACATLAGAGVLALVVPEWSLRAMGGGLALIVAEFVVARGIGRRVRARAAAAADREAGEP